MKAELDCNPVPLLNDGLMEFQYSPGEIGFKGLASLFQKFAQGGIQAYGHMEMYRCSQLKVVNKNYDANGYLIPQPISLDGELFHFKHFYTSECLHEAVELVVDIDAVAGHHMEQKRQARAQV